MNTARRIRLLAGYVVFGAGAALSVIGWLDELELDIFDALGLFGVAAGVAILMETSAPRATHL
jgi:hypothetical protein